MKKAVSNSKADDDPRRLLKVLLAAMDVQLSDKQKQAALKLIRRDSSLLKRWPPKSVSPHNRRDDVSARCMDCKIDPRATGEIYMLTDELWRRINPWITGVLCLNCAENRLGRPLTRSDFSSVPINAMGAEVCRALAKRLRRAAFKMKLNPYFRSDQFLKTLSKRLNRMRRTRSGLGRTSAVLLFHGKGRDWSGGEVRDFITLNPGYFPKDATRPVLKRPVARLAAKADDRAHSATPRRAR